MFSIGDFARHGRVSVRMLRHDDAIGLLRPARVDAANGYRCYQAAQLADLNRIVALKDLGFTHEQVRSVLDERVSGDELRGMLGCGGPSWRRRSAPTTLGCAKSRRGSARSRARAANRWPMCRSNPFLRYA
jgi:DNA-binding transcriptional MerR regulator